MKKVQIYLLLPAALLCVYTSMAQLTGIKNIPGDYASLDAAITDLNSQGVGSGGVTLNLVAGNPQIAPAGGYIINATGTVVNPIVITGNSNTITTSPSLTVGALNDAIFRIAGGDYITIQEFSMTENPLNLTTTAASNNMTEFGIALFYASPTDGAKHNTIQNNTITLNRAYANTFGIYSTVRHTSSSVTTAADISAASGSNSNNKVYGNNISNVNFGMVFVGSLTGAYMDTGLDIGGAGVSTGNTITDFGTTATFSLYVSVTTSINGINVNNQLGVNISYNTITSSNGVAGTGTIRGIYCQASGVLPSSGTYTRTINHNDISVKGGNTANVLHGILHDHGNSTISLAINENNFHDIDHTSATASGVINFINASGSAVSNIAINGNTFFNLSVKTTGNVILIDKTATHPANAVINVNDNAITGTILPWFIKTGAGGNFRGYSSGGGTPSGTENNNGNNFSNISVTGATGVSMWTNQDGPTVSPFGCTKTISNNTFTGITFGSGTVTIISVTGGNSSSSNNVSNNTINNISGAGSITAILSSNGSQDFTSNTINNLSSTGAVQVNAINVSAGERQNILRNKIYSLTADNASGTVNGLLVNPSGVPISMNIYNNLIGDLNAPATNSATDAIRGISFVATTPSAIFDVAFNTIYINGTSSGTNFSSSGIFHTFVANASSAVLKLRNNIIVNTSQPNGTGLAVALRRSASTNLNNFALESNNNLLYAGTPAVNRLLFYDGTNADQVLSDYKTRVSPREINSITELPSFVSLSGSSPDFLHINPAIATQVESGGIPITGITDDYDVQTRNANTPDIGADEFSGIAVDQSGPSIIFTPLGSTNSTSNRTLIATITDASGVASGGSAPLIYYRKGTVGAFFSSIATSISGNDYTFTIDYLNVSGGSVAPGDIIQYYIAAQDNGGNLSTNPFGGSGITPPGSTTPLTFNEYKISQLYTWQGITDLFQTASNWSPARTTPDASDILVFDGSVTPSTTVNDIPNQTNTRLVFQNNINATLNASVSSNTLTLSYASEQTAFDIQAGSTLNLGTTSALNITFDPAINNTIATISGSLNINNSSTYTASPSITTVSGSVVIAGNAATPLAGTKQHLIFEDGSILQYSKNGGQIPIANYASNSTINLVGAFTTAITLTSQLTTIGNLSYNSTGTSNLSFSNNVTTVGGTLLIQNTGTGNFSTGNNAAITVSVAGDVIINGGTFNITGNQMDIAGNLVQNGGSLVKTSTAGIRWSTAGVNQSAGTFDMAAVNGLFNLNSTTGNAVFAGTVNGGTGSTGGLILEFTGSGNQTLNTTGTTVSNKIGITVDKSSGDCILADNFTINNGAELALINGKLTINAGKTLTIGAGASLIGASSSNYVVTMATGTDLGKLQYSNMPASPAIFPIGTAIDYMPVTITPDNPGANFAAGVFADVTNDGTPNGVPFSSPILSNLVNGTWQIDRSVVATPATVTFNWNNLQEGNKFSTLSNAAIGIIRHNGVSYDAITGTADNTTNTATASFASFSPFVIGTSVPKTATRIFLQGAYNAGLGRHKDASALWVNRLNADALNQPYSAAQFNYPGTESVSAGFFVSTGATTDILDWMLLELRDQTTPATIIASRAAFVREDGLIVDLDGVSDVVFGGVPSGNYYLAIRHRNHLGIRTSVTLGIDGTLGGASPTLYDFTTSQTQAFDNAGVTTNDAMAQNGSTFLMFGGNANPNIGGNPTVRFFGLNNDAAAIVAALGGNQGLTLNAYSPADLNMDGQVKFTGLNNDAAFLVAVLAGNQAAVFNQH